MVVGIVPTLIPQSFERADASKRPFCKAVIPESLQFHAKGPFPVQVSAQSEPAPASAPSLLFLASRGEASN